MQIDVMGVRAIVQQDKTVFRVALPAFCLGKEGKPDVYFWAGEIKNGKVISVSAESARNYLEQAAKSLESKP